MIISKLRRLSPKGRRKLIAITIAVLVALAMIAYAFWSVTTWNSYKTTYENWQKDVRASVNATIASPQKTSADRAKKLSDLKNISTKITTAQQSLCRTPGLITWQHVISSLREREEACNGVIAKTKTFGENMQTATSFLDDEQALTVAVQTAIKASDSKVTEATWGAQVGIWQDASKAIEKISSKEAPFNPVKTAAIDKTNSLVAAWQALITAHTAKDKAKYIEAQTKLATAYDGLSDLVTVDSDQLVKLTNSLQAAYSQAFASTT